MSGSDRCCVVSLSSTQPAESAGDPAPDSGLAAAPPSYDAAAAPAGVTPEAAAPRGAGPPPILLGCTLRR